MSPSLKRADKCGRRKLILLNLGFISFCVLLYGFVATQVSVSSSTAHQQLDSGNRSREVGEIDKINMSRTSNDPSSHEHEKISIPTKMTITSSKIDAQPMKSMKQSRPLYVTSHFMGRLGNLMFMYATMVGIALSQNRIPVMHKGETKLQGTFQLTHVGSLPKGTRRWADVKYATFHEDLMHLPTDQNMSLGGYRQSWRYFQNHTDHIRKEFTFKPQIQKDAAKILKDVLKGRNYTTLVGVHVRRGDFLKPRNIKLGYTTAPKSYFEKAMTLLKTRYSNETVLFLVGSNDENWCKTNLNGNDVIVLPPASDSVHMAILGQCSHVIMSTGSYGWWSGFLSGGDVVYFKDYPAKDSRLSSSFTPSDHFFPEWTGLSG